MRWDDGDLAQPETDSTEAASVSDVLMLLKGMLSLPLCVGSIGGMWALWLISVTSCFYSQLGTAYVSATTGAVVTALGLKSLTKVRWPLAIAGWGTATFPVVSP